MKMPTRTTTTRTTTKQSLEPVELRSRLKIYFFFTFLCQSWLSHGLCKIQKSVYGEKLKAFSNEINPNPNIFLNRPLTFYYYIKGAITVLTEYFKYYHATCGNAAQLIFTPSSALPELASCV
jgi:hypothetical protein